MEIKGLANMVNPFFFVINLFLRNLLKSVLHFLSRCTTIIIKFQFVSPTLFLDRQQYIPVESWGNTWGVFLNEELSKGLRMRAGRADVVIHCFSLILPFLG
ncbi:hypothetical protein GeomeDRAFT_0513 [Geobacter metallireducens RCH3]|uniref:hypothetical protein n=1 Tax=Geobacter metallireducens TaxID=28232 RepID=UPI000053C5C0|nr:hypothetical protein [Geobacter metallireducens]EHP88632.1 hypothetical protein GeomeDRAFT_0513 [Geobacter metallireducens RCH3]